MFARILVAVDDSPASLDAARVGLELAAHHGSQVRAITVPHDGGLAHAISGDVADTAERLAAGGRSVLAWVADLAAAFSTRPTTGAPISSSWDAPTDADHRRRTSAARPPTSSSSQTDRCWSCPTSGSPGSDSDDRPRGSRNSPWLATWEPCRPTLSAPKQLAVGG